MGRIVTLKIYSSVELAELAHQFLAENEISSTVQVDNIGGMNPALNVSLGVKLLVDEFDLAKAQELLQIN